MPGYRRPGRLRTLTPLGTFNAVAVDLELSREGHLGGAFRARTTLGGHYAQRYDSDPDGSLRGYGRLLALGSAFEFEEVERPGAPDYLAIMKVIGPVWELAARGGGLRFRWLGEVYADFAMVKSLAMEGRMAVLGGGQVYHPADSGGTIPGVLGARGYYYALGLTAGTRLELDYGGWQAGLEWHGDQFRSIAGLDRFQEEMQREIRLGDRRAALRSWLGLRPGPSWPRFQVGFDWRWRDGWAELLRREHVDRRVTGGLSFVY